MEKSYLDVLIVYDIAPSLDMFYEYQGLMGHKAQVMEKLLTKLQGALEGCHAREMLIMND